ncbi:MAG: serine hydroxymethyltransferase [Myxococcaceae bacterium]
MENTATLSQVDPAIAEILHAETRRQEDGLELIASENFVSPAVLEASGSVLTNKYAEGYPGKRYYGGCEEVDKAEALAIDRVLKLFGAQAANVQPHSGSQANMAAFMALMKPGELMLTLDLNSGGHLTHGSSFNFSGKTYKVAHYGLSKETETIDFAQVESLAKEHKPRLLIVGASAYPRTLDFPRFKAIADSVGASMLVDMAHIAGLVAGGMHPNPVPHADIVTSTTHKTLRGPRSGLILMKEQYAKSVNSNVFPGIQGGPMMHTIAAKAVAFHEALQPSFKEYAQQVVKNAQALAEGLKGQGLRLVSGGTDNHLMLVDLRAKKLTGKIAEEVLGNAGITVNKNQIPFDPEKPTVSSGVRIGAPALTTRGMKEADMATVATLIGKALDHATDDAVLTKVRGEVAEFTKSFPLYASRLKKG